MSRRILLVDSDVEALGNLASALRARGLTVSNASDPFEAVELAFQTRPDVVLIAPELDGEGELSAAFRAVPELIETPLLRLLHRGDLASLADNEVLRSDLDHIVARVSESSPKTARASLLQDIGGTLEQVPLPDLLQLLAMNRRSGVLSITTKRGLGEVRLTRGDVIDAAFRGLDGEKAVYRLLGLTEGRFAFTPSEPTGPRRIKLSTSMLLMEGMRQVDEVARMRVELAPAGEGLILNDAGSSPPSGAPPSSGGAPSLPRMILTHLQIPCSIDELLDELPAPDLSILSVLTQLDNEQRLRRIALSDLTTPFAPAEQLAVLRSLVTRLARPGFASPPRLVIAARGKRIPALAHAIRRISDVSAPSNAAPTVAVARPLGTLRLGDDVDLALTALPTEPVFAPTWGLSLAGAAAVVRLEDAGGMALDAHCEAAEVMLIEAESLMGALDVAVPAQVAALVRSALEMAAGV